MIYKTYIINGSGESGKDKFIEFIKQYIKVNNIQDYLIYNDSTVDQIRYFLNDLDLHEKTDEWRNAMGKIKNICESLDENVFNRDMFSKVYNRITFRNDFNKISFIHCREPENIEKIKQMFKNNQMHCETILIKRKEVYNKFSCEKDSLDFISNYDYDHIIENNDLEEFRCKAIGFFDIIINKN